MTSLSEVIADIKRNTTNNSICPETLTDPYWDPFDSNHGPGALAPETIPSAFRSPTSAQASRGNDGNACPFPTPANLTTGGPSDLEYTNSPSASETDFDRVLRLTRRPAPPELDMAKCLRYPWHDPFMGASCSQGAGEQSKPFPWLTGRPIAEEPKMRKLQKMRKLPSVHTKVKDVYPNGGGRMGYKWHMEQDSSTVFHAVQYKIRDDDLPSNEARVRAANHIEAEELDLNIDPFGNATSNQTVRLTAIINHLNDNSVLNLLDSWKPDEKSGEPGPYVDFTKLAGVCSMTRLPPPLKDVFSEMLICRKRYFVAWDLFFGLLRAIYDLEEERSRIWQEANEMNINPVNDGGKKRGCNIWRWRENSREMDEMVQRLGTCKGGLTTCAKNLVELKIRAAPFVSKIFSAHARWVESRKDQARDTACSGKSNENNDQGDQAVDSFQIAGQKRAREENGEELQEVE